MSAAFRLVGAALTLASISVTTSTAWCQEPAPEAGHDPVLGSGSDAALSAGLDPALAATREDQPRYGHDIDRLGWYVPDYVKIQTGGFLGAFQGVVGYAIWKDRFNVEVQYGFTPKWESAPPVHIFAATATVRPVRIDLGPALFVVPLYVGGGAMVSRGKNLFVQQPDIYPAGYYPPTAVQYLALAGLEVGAHSREGSYLTRQSLFFELVTINQYLDAFIDNKQARLLDGLSSSVGYRASF